MIKVITHSGNFHADDVFAVAALSILLDGKFEMIRTRDQNIINTGDYVVDVGGEYDPRSKRFDHHQERGAGMRENGVPYAAFGLVWKEYGKKICISNEVAARIDEKLVQIIDAYDNGMEIVMPILGGVHPYTIDDYISLFKPTWKEGGSIDEAFKIVLERAIEILNREIKQQKHMLEAEEKVVDAYEESVDKRLVVLDSFYPWQDVLINFKEPLFAVYPNPHDKTWNVQCVKVNRLTFENRKDLPENWAGRKSHELADISGVKDAVFCHNKRFMAVARSKEGAVSLAIKAMLN